MTKRTTIKDVASAAGVSPKTVSNYLNGTANVSPSTAERIASSISSLNYTPNSIAQRFRTGKSYVIGFIADIRFLDHPVTHQLEYELQIRLKESRYSLEVIVVDDDDRNSPVDTRVLDGLIVASAGDKIIARLSDLDIPIVYLRRLQSGYRHRIVVDDYAGGTLAAQYLLENNHRKIGILMNKSKLVGDDFQYRKTGFVDTLAAAGIKPTVELEPPLEMAVLPKWFTSLDDQLTKHDVTAYFATTDLTAINLINHLYENRIRVPDEVSVIGFDNIQFASLCIPPLTTVSGQFDKLARLAAKQIIDAIESQESENMLVTIEPQLIERKSVRKL